MTKKIKHFKTNVLLKSIIGKDLINDDNIAVLELVKNSYDANSGIVNITFRNLKENDDLDNESYSKDSSKIIIQDYGSGMEENDIENKWLNIAYSEKKKKKVEHNRILAGAKGVGRFSCDRLGEYLDIYTRRKNKQIFHLYVDWKSFEIEDDRDLEIQNIQIQLETIPEKDFKKRTGYDLFEKGTILEISKLRSTWAIEEQVSKSEKKWNVERVLELRKSLEKLINPNQVFKKSGFKINLLAKELLEEDKKEPAHRKVNGEIKNKIFEKLDFTSTSITSAIDDSGEIITTTITDKGRDIFILQEKNVYFPLLKDVNVVLYYLNTYSKIYFAKQTGIRSVDFGSIYLFINGFRIPPYGDFGDDWLGLETRKGQGYARFLGTRELIGRVEIKDSISQFKIVSSREGLVKDSNFDQLADKNNGYLYYTLKRLERYVVDGLDWDRLSKKKKKGEEPVDDELSDNKSLKKFISDFEKKTNSKGWKFSQNEEKYYEDQIVKNRRILSIIDSIIDVKKDNIIDLYINEDLIVELVKEQQEKAKQDFDKIISDMSNLTDGQVEILVEKIKDNNEHLEVSLAKISEFSSGKLNNQTSAALKTTSRLHSSIEKDFSRQETLIKKLMSEKKEAERKVREEEQARLKAEDEKNKLEEQLAVEKEKNTYLRATSKGLTEDAKGLVHNIKHTSKAIKSSVDYLYDILKDGKARDKELYDKLGVIRYNAEKVLRISSIITRANFKADQNHQVLDLVRYVSQYLDIYNDIFEKSRLNIEVRPNSVEFVKRFSALDVSLIFDDLISNAEKASAKKVLIEFKKLSSGKLRILISDDGKGVSKRFLQAPDSMFELGVTETDGSGIGLNSVRKTLKTIQGEISFLGNGKSLKGASFQIIVEK